MSDCKVYLNKNEEDRIIRGHAWVFSNEVSRLEGKVQSGDIVSVYSHAGLFLGQGFLNTASKIFVRIVSRSEAKIDEEFFRRKLVSAKYLRVEAGFGETYRAFFAEADGIPGLIVDKYSQYLSVQFLTLGVDIRRDMFIRLLVGIYQPLGIYERSDVAVREKEGLPERTGVCYGEIPAEVEIREGDLSFLVDIQNGQKTGTFLDQSRNHQAIRSYCPGKRVLDCFSHNGNFALQAKAAGAEEVIAVDLSREACATIARNAELNKLEITIVQADVFEFLRKEIQNSRPYGLIVLDPPAFTKTRQKLPQALRGYKDINLQAMRLLEDGGILVSASCSHYLDLFTFMDVLGEAAMDAGKSLKLLEIKTQAPDHPALIGSEETLYLKFLILKVDTLKKEDGYDNTLDLA